eukprot:CAMPEP_0119090132 /NCGR_PEP_ID=MMETSP1178-20130426/151479_1 /TAXON_ID=33656 /ORGANISM="unid sp, Strain CCMP2000" /LENGTH=61 /DNA_ID=CAMNT_0007073525 /DNA_START=46 /DNA_END=228 /DNA_ORIENTATION=-
MSTTPHASVDAKADASAAAAAAEDTSSAAAVRATFGMAAEKPSSSRILSRFLSTALLVEMG